MEKGSLSVILPLDWPRKICLEWEQVSVKINTNCTLSDCLKSYNKIRLSISAKTWGYKMLAILGRTQSNNILLTTSADFVTLTYISICFGTHFWGGK